MEQFEDEFNNKIQRDLILHLEKMKNAENYVHCVRHSESGGYRYQWLASNMFQINLRRDLMFNRDMYNGLNASLLFGLGIKNINDRIGIYRFLVDKETKEDESHTLILLEDESRDLGVFEPNYAGTRSHLCVLFQWQF